MPLDKPRLKTSLKAAFNDVNWQELEREPALDLFCEKLASAFIEEVKQLKVVYQNGLGAPNGPVTGSINHTIS